MQIIEAGTVSTHGNMYLYLLPSVHDLVTDEALEMYLFTKKCIFKLSSDLRNYFILCEIQTKKFIIKKKITTKLEF